MVAWAVARGVTGVVAVGMTVVSFGVAPASAASRGASPAITPANDAFANPVVLPKASSSRTGDTNVGATKEAGEPQHAGFAGGSSVWYEWLAAGSGAVTIDTTKSSFDTLLAVYTGTTVSALTSIASNDDNPACAPACFTSKLSFTATAGVDYRIAIDGQTDFTTPPTGTIALHLKVDPPANDAFANAIALSGATVSRTSDSNVSATKEAGEPNHAGDPGGASVWYSWTAPTTRTVAIDTMTSGFDTVLAVYTGNTVSALTSVASNDDNASCGPCLTSRLTFVATSGTTYRIAVDGYSGGAVATGRIALHLTNPPPNDDFANAIVLTGANVSRSADTNVAATKQSGEPNHAGNPGGASVWYAWTAPNTGQVALDTSGSTFDTLLGVYTGGAVNGLNTIIANDDDTSCAPCLTSRVSFLATGGMTYRIAVDGDADFGHGFGTVALHLVAAPANDAFANAIAVAGGAVTRTGDTNVGATKESGEPNHASDIGGASVWYSWTAPVAAMVDINTAGSNFDTLLAVYTGSAVNALTAVASNDDDPTCGTCRTSRLAFTPSAGVTYRIAIDGVTDFEGSVPEGSITLQVAQVGAATVTGFTPAAVAQKKVVTILGSGFTGATAVTFTKAGGGTVNATTFSLNDDGHISATVPALATTGPVSVTTPTAVATSATNLKIKATIKSFTPGSGAVGATVFVTGTALTGATKVTLNGKTTRFSVVSDTTISFKVPVGATSGAIQITTAGGKVTSATTFAVS
jgi:hypothetical protein